MKRRLNSILILGVVALLFTGCQDPYEEVYPKYQVWMDNGLDYADADKMADFQIKLAQASNPKSDEEPEDMLEQINYNMRTVFQKAYIGLRVKRKSYDIVFIPEHELKGHFLEIYNKLVAEGISEEVTKQELEENDEQSAKKN